MKSEQYLGCNSLREESHPLMTVLKVAKLTYAEVDKIAEAFKNQAVYYGEGYGHRSTVLIGGHHDKDKFNFLGEKRKIKVKNVFGWPKGFPRIIIPPTERNSTNFAGLTLCGRKG